MMHQVQALTPGIKEFQSHMMKTAIYGRNVQCTNIKATLNLLSLLYRRKCWIPLGVNVNTCLLKLDFGFGNTELVPLGL